MKRVIIIFLVINFAILFDITKVVHGQEPMLDNVSGIISDDFNGATLDTALWTFVNPLADAKIEMTGKQFGLTLPAGVNHDAWKNGNTAPRIMQSANNTDFEIEVKFESTFTEKIQDHGILIEETENRFLRFDTYFDGAKCHAFSALVDGGLTAVKVNKVVAEGSPTWLRISRIGDDWTYLYSLDGQKWETIITFAQSLIVTKVGLYTGNVGSGSAPPYTLLADYFFGTNNINDPDDGDSSPPVISNISVINFENTTEISWNSDEKATSRVDFGLSTIYSDFEENLALTTEHVLVLTGLIPNTLYHYQITSKDSRGNTATTPDLILTTRSQEFDFVSDDFSDASLDTSLWTIIDPIGDSVIEMTGTHLVLSVPGGVNHDAWTHGNTAVRIMQPAQNSDFELEVKFESSQSVWLQNQGILIEDNSGRFLRFDLIHNGSYTRAFAAFIDGEIASVKFSSRVSDGVPVWLRVARTGAQWTFSNSMDGQTWTDIVNFTQQLTVTAAGPFAGNAGGNVAPPHSVLVDYFFNTSKPIHPEDGGAIDFSPPNVMNISVKPAPSSAAITWTTDEYATSRIDCGPSPIYGTFKENLGLTKNHSVVIEGLNQNTVYHYQITTVDAAGNASISNDADFQTKIDVKGPTLEVWHGLAQKVGHLGDAQDDFNLMGNVFDSSEVVSLTYSLNVGPPISLTVGNRPDGYGDGRRLASTGDFNADIPVKALNPGLNTILLTATDGEGNISSETVTIDRQTGSSSLPYTIDWNTVNHPQDVGQYVDGKWGLDTNGLRILRTGYDRLFLIGERAWQDYEITVPVTINGIDDVPSGGNQGLGIIMRFTGHIVGGYRNWRDAQPKWGYQPFGAIGWLRWIGPRMQFFRGDYDNYTNHGHYNATVGNMYWMKMQCETLPDNANGFGVTLYKWKIWQDDFPEPSDWSWQEVQTSEYALRQGGIALVAHNVDATFGNIEVIPLSVDPDTTRPVIGDIAVTTKTTSATITWVTNEATRAKLVYRTESINGEVSVIDPEFKTHHSVTVDGLIPTSKYFCVITSSDANGNTAISPDFGFSTTSASPGSFGIVTDDFNDAILDTSVWSFINPLGDASVSMTGEQVMLSIPGKVEHEAWIGGNTTARIMQAINNTDFEVEVKFDSHLTKGTQIQGVLIEETVHRYLRFDFVYDGSLTRAFSAMIDHDAANVKANVIVTDRSPRWLRIARLGNEWKYAYSLDGQIWTEVTSFSQPLTVSSVGLCVGNSGGSSTPEHAVLVDYFRTRLLTNVVAETDDTPDNYALSPAYPNPFNPSTQFRLTLLERQHVKLEVFNVLGQRVAELNNNILPARTHIFKFDASGLPSGVYFIRARGHKFIFHRKVTFQK